MKRSFLLTVALSVALMTGCGVRERRVIILSTNDIHAQIKEFPRLATAVEMCRDTADVILIDAGDRWTGNAYVDLAEGRRPILELMNKLGYDAATFGNHEFDVGQQVLQEAVDYARFPVICANFTGEGTPLHTPRPYLFIERGGVKLGLVAVVTNYGSNNHPDGHDAIFEGLTFTDAVETAAEYQYLADSCDVLVALTHIGSEKDRELADEAAGFNLIIGGHSHEEINEVEDGVLITQTGKNLRNVGVTEILLKGDNIREISFRLVPLKNYAPDPAYQAMVEEYYKNPRLQVPVGEMAAQADKTGLANLYARSVMERAGADVGFYHIGGVRLDYLPQGIVTLARIYDMDPFGSLVSTMTMTPAQMRRMIVEKYNDKVNVGESHRIDLYSTTPYVIVTDDEGEAEDVLFPDLKEGSSYKVALGDYVFKNYGGLEYTDGVTTDILLTDVLQDYIANAGKPLTPDNTVRQSVRPEKD